MTIKISNENDRRMVAGILVANGYTVSIGRLKVGKTTKTVIVAEEKKWEIEK